MTASLFIALVVGVAAMVFRACRQAGIRTALIVGIGLMYLAVPGTLAWRGMLDRYDPMPAPALLMILVVTIMTLTILLTSPGKRLIEAVGLPALVGFQVFRVPVEWLLHRLYLEGVVPIQMTYAGRNFDIVSGVTAAALALWLARARPPRGLLVVWNIAALALLANIVTIALLSTPVPFRRFLEDPPNLLPSLFPYIWLPTFLVQMALAGHVLVFRRLFSAR